MIEAATESLDQQNAGEQAPLELLSFYERLEDMGQGRLRVILDGDSDACLSIISSEGEMADVEFCVPFSGGGRSPKVWDALIQLGKAIRDENAANPIYGQPVAEYFGAVEDSFAVASRNGEHDLWRIVPASHSTCQDASFELAGTLARGCPNGFVYAAVVLSSLGIKPVGSVQSGATVLS